MHSVEETIHIDNEGVCGNFVNVKMICRFGLSEVLIGIKYVRVRAFIEVSVCVYV